MQFETDANGNIILSPVTGWELHNLGIALLLTIQYAENQSDIETEDKRQQLQFGLMPKQALQLAEALTKSANNLLGAKLPPSVPLQ